MNLLLANKVALVTGSDRRTGEIIADTLAAEGATVIYHGNTEAPNKTLAVKGDVASEEGCAELVTAVRNLGLSVDILINNYGTADMHSWSNSSTEKWLEMYQVNVLSAARMVQAFVQEMKDSGWGRIINLGTIGSHQPNNIMPAYYAAKGALATMGVSLAKELSSTGITVNTVAPGLIRTEQVEQGFRKRAAKHGWGEDWDTIVSNVVAKDYPNPCGRIAEREEVADLVAFLCSPRADFINGQNIRIDGGAVSYV
ncbi:MAG: SDR family NAD(P)-dependent oxidoreductase [Pseudomonadales bacterium]